MAGTVRVYVKKQLRLDLLSFSQRQMWALGNAGLDSIKGRVAKARGPEDTPAAPLKSKSWANIKKSMGLRPIRDLHGTGKAWPQKIKGRRRKKWALQNVGHLMDQLAVRRVAENKAFIDEPTTRFGRIKARAQKSMLMFSPQNRKDIYNAARLLLSESVSKLVRAYNK